MSLRFALLMAESISSGLRVGLTWLAAVFFNWCDLIHYGWTAWCAQTRAHFWIDWENLPVSESVGMFFEWIGFSCWFLIKSLASSFSGKWCLQSFFEHSYERRRWCPGLHRGFSIAPPESLFSRKSPARHRAKENQPVWRWSLSSKNFVDDLELRCKW